MDWPSQYLPKSFLQIKKYGSFIGGKAASLPQAVLFTARSLLHSPSLLSSYYGRSSTCDAALLEMGVYTSSKNGQ